LIFGRLVVGLRFKLDEDDGLGLVDDGLGLVDDGLGLVDEDGLGLVDEGLGLTVGRFFWTLFTTSMGLLILLTVPGLM
jgi:hypothetical protein